MKYLGFLFTAIVPATWKTFLTFWGMIFILSLSIKGEDVSVWGVLLRTGIFIFIVFILGFLAERSKIKEAWRIYLDLVELKKNKK